MSGAKPLAEPLPQREPYLSRGRSGRSATLVIRPARLRLATIPDGIAALRDYTDLLYTLSAHRISVRYRQTALGVVWAVLQPLLMMLIFTAVFSMLARMPSEGAPYALFAYTALLPWTFFATAFSNATASLVTNNQLITKVYFPREILPASCVITALFDFAIGFGVLVGLLVWFGVPLTVQAVHLVPVVFLLSVWAFGISLIFATLQVRWRDIGMALPLLVQLWMFASPVIYPLSAVPEAWRGWYLLNPMAGIISAFRDVLLRGAQPDPAPLAYAVLVTAGVLPLSYAVFKSAEATMADVI